MATLLYHWNFTGANDLAVDDEINDSESNLKAVFKSFKYNIIFIFKRR